MSNVTEKNKAHWDEHAANYDARFQKTMDQLVSLLRDPSILSFINVPWIPDTDTETDTDTDSPQSHTLKLLDYACGTGLITRAFLPYITRAIGIDLSGSMVTQYNLHAHNQGLSQEEMVAVEGNLLMQPRDARLAGEGKEDLFEFDVAVVGLGFHHFSDARLAATRLAERLKKGGALVVLDFESHEPVHGGDGHGHGHGHSHGHAHDEALVKGEELQLGEATKQVKETITHHGFAEEEMRSIFEEAGVGGGFGYRVLGKGIVFHGVHGDGKAEGERKEMKRGVFIARGTKV
ncbi:hypothetical protein ACMFMG_007287 [Clarireedia jacksonii]